MPKRQWMWLSLGDVHSTSTHSCQVQLRSAVIFFRAVVYRGDGTRPTYLVQRPLSQGSRPTILQTYHKGSRFTIPEMYMGFFCIERKRCLQMWPSNMSQDGVWPGLCRMPNGRWRKGPEDQSQSTDVRKQGQTGGHCTAGSQDGGAPKLKGTKSVNYKRSRSLFP